MVVVDQVVPQSLKVLPLRYAIRADEDVQASAGSSGMIFILLLGGGGKEA